MVTMVAPVQIGQVVKIVDASQFQRPIWIGAVERLVWDRGRLHARVHRWPVWVPVDQLVPLKKGMQ